MSEEEKYWGCTPVVTAHMEARMKASREYAKMVSNDNETPTQRADRARDFECGAIWEEGYSKKHGWHPASELPVVPEGEDEVEVYCLVRGKGLTILVPMKLHYTVSRGFGVSENIEIKWWCYPPEED